MKILVIGNSFVEGVGATDKKGWAFLLKEEAPLHDFILSGVGGDNILKILNRVSNVPNIQFDIVILEVGLNDSRFRPSLQDNEVPLNSFSEKLMEFHLFFKSKNEKCENIFLGLTHVNEGLTNPYKKDKHYLNDLIEQYDGAVKKVASQIGARYFSVPVLADNLNNLSDGLHPSDTGHALIKEFVKNQLISIGVL